jgi:hypothetical protein
MAVIAGQARSHNSGPELQGAGLPRARYGLQTIHLDHLAIASISKW